MTNHNRVKNLILLMFRAILRNKMFDGDCFLYRFNCNFGRIYSIFDVRLVKFDEIPISIEKFNMGRQKRVRIKDTLNKLKTTITLGATTK